VKEDNRHGNKIQVVNNPPVEEDEGEVEEKFLSRYYIKKGQCPKSEVIWDWSECVNKFAQIKPDRVSSRANKKYTSNYNGGCMLNWPRGVYFNDNTTATDGSGSKEFLCLKAEEDMPDFEAMRKDNNLLMWHCLKKTSNFGGYKQCMIEIADKD